MDPPGLYPFTRQLMVLSRLWRNELDRRLKPKRLSQARLALLVHCEEGGREVTQLDLADRAGIRGPTLVRQLDQLESEGLVERRDSPADRRAKVVYLKESGRSAMQEARIIADELRLEVLRDCDPEEIEQLQSLITRMTRRLDAIGARAPVAPSADDTAAKREKAHA